MEYHAKTYYYPVAKDFKGKRTVVVQDVKARQAYIERGLIKPITTNPGLVEAYKRQESGCFGKFERVLPKAPDGENYNDCRYDMSKEVFVSVNYGITGKMYRDS